MDIQKRKQLWQVLRDLLPYILLLLIAGLIVGATVTLKLVETSLMHYCRPTPVRNEFVCTVPDGGFPSAPSLSPVPNKQTNKQTYFPALNKQTEISL